MDRTELYAPLVRVPGLDVRLGLPLGPHTTLRVGGAAECFVQVSQRRALETLLRFVSDEDLPFWVLGHGSNVLVPAQGLDGVVARLDGEFKRVHRRGPWVRAGSGVTLAQLARTTAGQGLVGLEALSGFPSTVGGAVVMNAGCYGTEIKDLLVAVRGVGPDGLRRRFRVDDLHAGYRSTVLQQDRTLVTDATFRLRPGSAEAALQRIDELNRRRWQSLPSGLPTAGSIFRNPPGDFAGRLIESCHLKGEVRGGAQISHRHANVIVNRGGATSTDVLELMALAFQAVRRRFDVRLVPEIVLAGSLRDEWRKLSG